ncbi:hypothetical protein PR048_031156 [Dryococelus australis]|uniref:Uncharacterized protein n=1 Tax=Dryococelus australis TaxID=614101 RepID=A0ABQ9G4H0_9NEOP|nr:hypothetical protein PR048_031156 [Dryococelus australis]
MQRETARPWRQVWDRLRAADVEMGRESSRGSKLRLPFPTRATASASKPTRPDLHLQPSNLSPGRCDVRVTLFHIEALARGRGGPVGRALVPQRGELGSTPSVVILSFRTWESRRTMPLVGGFSRGFPVSSRPSTLGAAPYPPRFTSSVLKTSLFKVVQISSLHVLTPAGPTSTSDLVLQVITPPGVYSEPRGRHSKPLAKARSRLELRTLQSSAYWSLSCVFIGRCPTPGGYGIRKVFPCESAIGSEACRAGLINYDPIAKAGILSPLRIGASTVCSLTVAPHLAVMGFARCFFASLLLAPEAFRVGLTNCDPIAKSLHENKLTRREDIGPCSDQEVSRLMRKQERLKDEEENKLTRREVIGPCSDQEVSRLMRKQERLKDEEENKLPRREVIGPCSDQEVSRLMRKQERLKDEEENKLTRREVTGPCSDQEVSRLMRKQERLKDEEENKLTRREVIGPCSDQEVSRLMRKQERLKDEEENKLTRREVTGPCSDQEVSRLMRKQERLKDEEENKLTRREVIGPCSDQEVSRLMRKQERLKDEEENKLTRREVIGPCSDQEVSRLMRKQERLKDEEENKLTRREVIGPCSDQEVSRLMRKQERLKDEEEN